MTFDMLHFLTALFMQHALNIDSEQGKRKKDKDGSMGPCVVCPYNRQLHVFWKRSHSD